MPDNDNGHHGLLLEFGQKPFSEPAAEQFDGAAILDRVSDFIKRYISLTEPQARLVTIWIAHTHAVSASTTIRVAAARYLSSYSSHASPSSSGGVVFQRS